MWHQNACDYLIQYTLMAACCCLCRDPVSADHRRRKKLHGLGCKIAKAVLRKVSPVPLGSVSGDQRTNSCFVLRLWENIWISFIVSRQKLKHSRQASGGRYLHYRSWHFAVGKDQGLLLTQIYLQPSNHTTRIPIAYHLHLHLPVSQEEVFQLQINWLLLGRSSHIFHLYAAELLSLGLLWHAFHDAVREGDGERILRHWKFMLVIFKSTTMPRKQWTCYFSITTPSQRERRPNFVESLCQHEGLSWGKHSMQPIYGTPQPKTQNSDL